MKKKKLKEFLDINLTGEKLDQLMKELLTEKFDADLRNKYADTLKSEYQVLRTDSSSTQKPSKKSASKLAIIALVAVLALVAYFAYSSLNASKENSVPQYLAENNMLYQGAYRNEVVTTTTAKAIAYQAFNKLEYDQFISLMASTTDLTNEDRFFIAYSKMKKENYTEAGNEFFKLSQMIRPEEKYYEETKLYQALCLLETDKSKFQNLFDSLEDNSWVKSELQNILN